jgi:hypothetical protein
VELSSHDNTQLGTNLRAAIKMFQAKPSHDVISWLCRCLIDSTQCHSTPRQWQETNWV